MHGDSPSANLQHYGFQYVQWWQSMCCMDMRLKENMQIMLTD